MASNDTIYITNSYYLKYENENVYGYSSEDESLILLQNYLNVFGSGTLYLVTDFPMYIRINVCSDNIIINGQNHLMAPNYDTDGSILSILNPNRTVTVKNIGIVCDNYLEMSGSLFIDDVTGLLTVEN